MHVTPYDPFHRIGTREEGREEGNVILLAVLIMTLLAALATAQFAVVHRNVQASSFFLANSDYDNLQAIVSLKPKYFSDAAGVDKLIGEMEALFRVDGDYSYIEKVILAAVRRIL